MYGTVVGFSSCKNPDYLNVFIVPKDPPVGLIGQAVFNYKVKKEHLVQSPDKYVGRELNCLTAGNFCNGFTKELV